MITTILAGLVSLAALGGTASCEKERELPPVPDKPFTRYTENLGLYSEKLGATVYYSVYLPDNYDKDSTRSYPVVYLTHGLGDDHKAWNGEYLKISSVIDNQESKGLTPMIYIMPQGYRTYYVNRFDGSYNYMDMFTEELVPFIDRQYRTIGDRDHRAVVGYSMGGFGAMILPSKNPELFSVSVPLSMSFRTDQQYMTESQNGWNTQWGSIFGGVGASGEARLTDYYKAHCPFYMFTAGEMNKYSGINYYLDCGDDEEQLLVANDDLHVQLRDINMPHQYRVRDGGHTSAYWRSAMQEVLPYIDACFKGIAYPETDTFILPDTHPATLEVRTLAGTEVHIYLPQVYTSDNEKLYPTVYFLHNANQKMTAEDVMKLLGQTQTNKPFVLAAFDATGIDNQDFTGIIHALESEYNLFTTAEYRTALGYDIGGKVLYESSLGVEPMTGSVFLYDATIDENIDSPNRSVFYFITIDDMGINYKGANALYKMCHSAGIGFQYRVQNGNCTRESASAALDKMRSAIYERIKTK